MEPLPPWFLQTRQDSPRASARQGAYHGDYSKSTHVKIFLLRLYVWRNKMSETRRRFDEEFKKNAVRLSYASNKSVAEVARDLDISDAILYRWRQKYTAEGDKTRFASMEEENKSLRLKVAQQAIEIDMLKKASAYFASLHK
jgi:transposase